MLTNELKTELAKRGETSVYVNRYGDIKFTNKPDYALCGVYDVSKPTFSAQRFNEDVATTVRVAQRKNPIKRSDPRRGHGLRSGMVYPS